MPLDYRPPLGLQHYFDVLRETKLKAGVDFPYAGMVIFSGAQGSGKTLLAMHMIHDILSAWPTCMFVSNINIFGLSALPYSGLSDFDRYQNGNAGIIFLIDEIQTYFCSNQSKEMPNEVLHVMSQNRKSKRLIVGTSQRWNRVAKPLREQTDFLYECKRPILNFFPYRQLDATAFDDDGNYTGEKTGFHVYVPNPRVMRSYNTLEIVKGTSVVPERSSSYAPRYHR